MQQMDTVADVLKSALQTRLWIENCCLSCWIGDLHTDFRSWMAWEMVQAFSVPVVICKGTVPGEGKGKQAVSEAFSTLSLLNRVGGLML